MNSLLCKPVSGNPVLERLGEIVETTRGACIVVLTTRTQPKLLKKSRLTGQSCPFENVEHIAQRKVIVKCRYASCVNRQRVREGLEADFEPEQLWNGRGRYVDGSFFLVEHCKTGHEYLAVRQLAVVRDLWLSNGEQVSEESLAEYMPAAHGSGKQETEKSVTWRTVRLDHIVGVRHGGEEVGMK